MQLEANVQPLTTPIPLLLAQTPEYIVLTPKRMESDSGKHQWLKWSAVYILAQVMGGLVGAGVSMRTSLPPRASWK